MMFEKIKELNAASALLGERPWVYIGDLNIQHGGTAVRMDSSGSYASVVECSDLASAIGQADCVMIDRGAVPMGRMKLVDRNRLRSALASFGWNASDLLQFPREERGEQMAYALWVYGYRDTETPLVIRYGPDDEMDDDPIRGRGSMEIDATVNGPDELAEIFIGNLV